MHRKAKVRVQLAELCSERLRQLGHGESGRHRRSTARASAIRVVIITTIYCAKYRLILTTVEETKFVSCTSWTHRRRFLAGLAVGAAWDRVPGTVECALLLGLVREASPAPPSPSPDRLSLPSS